MAMTKAQLLEKDAAPAWTGEVEGVGEVSIRLINGEDFDYIKNSPGNQPDTKGLLARWVVAGLCDENGKRMFSRNEYDAVNAMPFPRLKALAVAVQQHCGIGGDDAEDEPGNSPTTTPGGSGTA